MRKKGDTTNKICWNLKIYIDGEEKYNKDFKTITEIGEDLDLSYNIVSEMVMGRKKNKRGRYEPQYLFNRL
tara:strand:+ start:2776 stop:2988 length:213 start_codon:yes stop_codon:yes gene_type:complete